MLWLTLRQLKSDDYKERKKALRKLVTKPKQKALNALVEFLQNGNNEERQLAAEALGNLRDTRSIDPLCSALENDSYSREAAKIALVKIGKPSVETLKRALDNQNRKTCRAAAEALYELSWQPPDKTQSARLWVGLGEWKIAATLGKPGIDALLEACALEEMGTPDVLRVEETLVQKGSEAVETLIVALQHPNPDVRKVACSSLSKIKDKRAVDPLISVLQDDDDWVREAAIAALGNIGDRQAIQPLIRAFKHPGPNAFKIEESLFEIGPPYPIDELLSTLDENTSPSHISALGRFGDQRIIGPLLIALKRAQREDTQDKIMTVISFKLHAEDIHFAEAIETFKAIYLARRESSIEKHLKFFSTSRFSEIGCRALMGPGLALKKLVGDDQCFLCGKRLTADEWPPCKECRCDIEPGKKTALLHK